jgi:riboflavin biosynthesis pyrimidine reductase
MRRLLPHPADDIDPAEAYASQDRAPHDGRPWVMLNMIESLDGATAVAGRSGALGGPGDRAVFSAVRALADVVLVGAGTVRSEHYGAPKKVGQRIGVVTASADLDWTWPLFTSGAGFVVTTEDGPEVPVPTVRAGRGAIDLGAALGAIDADVVLCEGGPSLNGSMAAAGLLDEVCVTVAPTIVGGATHRFAGGNDLAVALELVHLLEDDGYLFCRYLVRRP